MAVFKTRRPTIYDAPKGLSLEAYKAFIPDSGRRRHLSFAMDFDTRALLLGDEVRADWDAEVKDMAAQSKANIRLEIALEYGEHRLDAKCANFVAIGVKPMSVLAYHNDFFAQVRNAYVMGDYYPALVGACALGERILNHLMIDLREFFKGTPEYPRVYRKDSFDNWSIPIDALEAWQMLLPEAVIEFKALMAIRHRSLHFNVSTYATLQEDALAAIIHMRTIIDLQFGTTGLRPWFIKGTRGHSFIRKDYEDHPFVKTYFAPCLAFVGPLFGMAPHQGGWDIFDVPDYGDGAWTDEEYAAEYEGRDPAKVLTEAPDIECDAAMTDAVDGANADSAA